MDRQAARGWLSGIAAAAALLALPVLAQVSAEDVHETERAAMGLGPLRPGADANDPQSPNAVNFTEALAGSYTVPPLFETAAQDTPAGWPDRRAEIARMIEDNWVGRIPAVVETFRIAWSKTPVASDYPGSEKEEWVGKITTRDGRSGPEISATITFPARAAAAPALISYTYVWPEGFDLALLAGDGPAAPDEVQQALDHGWAHVAYRPQALQADSGATMQDGVIGLARWPRQRYDWGALRAWAWGASRLREELAADPRISANRISLTGHSRFGKGVLVAAAFDPAFHDADISSSGAGGAKLMRRNLGERWENLAAASEFHWFAPNVMTFAADPLTVQDLPVDAHMLIALRAPHALFITSGLADKGDAWVDPAGMWTAFALAQPAWELFGESIPRAGMPVPQSTEQANYKLGWYQHGEGHVPWPGLPAFFDHAERFFED